METIFDGAEDQKDLKIIIFTSTKSMCDDLTSDLRYKGFGAGCLHGDKSQSERDWVLRSFKQGTLNVLIATDVAARGLGMYKKKNEWIEKKERIMKLHDDVFVFLKFSGID